MFDASILIRCAFQTGLIGCGPKIAIALAEFGFGKSLCSAARTCTREQFICYLSRWRAEVQTFLCTDPRGSMGYKHRALAKSVPNDFPNPDIVYMYTYPLTLGATNIEAVASTFCQPDFVRITHLCELYFPWATTDLIIEKFKKGVFQSLLMAALRDMATRPRTRPRGSSDEHRVCLILHAFSARNYSYLCRCNLLSILKAHSFLKINS